MMKYTTGLDRCDVFAINVGAMDAGPEIWMSSTYDASIDTTEYGVHASRKNAVIITVSCKD
jgi:hypothetical protein